MKRLTLILPLFLLFATAWAQTDFSAAVRFDRTVYDFGDIVDGSGPVNCSFNLTNISSAEWTVDQVVSSCGCTNVKWTRSSVSPGNCATIGVTYSNEDGPYAFDKTLTVYVSALKKPVILHIRGVARPEGTSLRESYPVHFGPLAFRSREIKVGNMAQGEYKSSEFTVANISSKTITVGFANVSEGLSVSVKNPRIKAGGTAKVTFTIQSNRTRWGENYYYATPLVNGKALISTGRENKEKPLLGAQSIDCESRSLAVPGSKLISFSAVTAENFSLFDKKRMAEAPDLEMSECTFSFGRKKAGAQVKADFSFTNQGKSELRVYKAEGCTSRIKTLNCTETLSCGQKGRMSMELDTSGLEPGEHLFIVNLFTNAPQRSVMSVYVTGIIE